jgi:hypothetical protein
MAFLGCESDQSKTFSMLSVNSVSRQLASKAMVVLRYVFALEVGGRITFEYVAT